MKKNWLEVIKKSFQKLKNKRGAQHFYDLGNNQIKQRVKESKMGAYCKSLLQ